MARRRFVWLVSMWATLSLVLGALSAPTAAYAQANDEEARMHFRLGTAYYDSGRFAEAAKEFKQAYELSQRPQLLYNLFLAYRDAGEIENAAAALKQYLADQQNIPEREMLEARLAALEKIIASRGPQQPQQEQAAAQPAPETPAETSPATEPEATKPAESAEPAEDKLKWLPYALIGGGGALIITGAVVGFLGQQDYQKLEDECPTPETCKLTDAEVADLKDAGPMKMAVGDAMWISGAVIAGTGALFLFWKPWNKTETKQAAQFDFACGPQGCGASYRTRF